MSKAIIKSHHHLINDFWRAKLDAPLGPAMQALADMVAKKHTTYPMTGLRRVILDAIQGCQIPPELVRCAHERGIKLFTFIGNQHYEAWAWDVEALELQPTDDLMSLYDTLRPGVLESMGKGE